MSDPVWKFEEPLRDAHAGAYALVMAAQGIQVDSEREAISFVARGVVRVLDEILVEATGHSVTTPPRPVAPTPLIESPGTVFSGHSPDDIQIRENRTTDPLPRELHTFAALMT